MSRVQSIERAFAVLGVLAEGPAGVSAIATHTRLPKSTVVRLLRALQAEDAVEQRSDDGRYRLGRRVATLAAGLRGPSSLVAVARPHLADLSTATGETTGLSIPDGPSVLYVDQVDAQHPVTVRDWTGTRLPMHAVSAGLVFLAHLAPAALEEYLSQPLERFTERTVRDPAELRARLRMVRLDGFAWTHDELADDITSVAAPVVDASGEIVAAVHVHGPSYRFPRSGEERRAADLAVRAGLGVAANLRQVTARPA